MMTDQDRAREALIAVLGRLKDEQAMLDTLGETKVARDLNVTIEALCSRLGIPPDPIEISKLTRQMFN